MHRPASAAFVEWEVETIIAMHSDFRLLDLLGIYSMYFCFLFFPLFCGSFFVFSLKIGKQHGKNGTKLLRTETAIRQPPKCRVHCDACGSCQTLRCESQYQYLQSLWVRSILHFVYLCVMGISITHCQYGIPWYYNCDKYHLLQY